MPDTDEPNVLGVTEAQLRNVATAAHMARTAGPPPFPVLPPADAALLDPATLRPAQLREAARWASERQLLRAARSVLLAHGHGIGATCAPLCWEDDRPLCPATLDDDLDPLACHLPAGHHSPDHYDRDRRCSWTTEDDRATPDPIPLPDDAPWPGGPHA